MSPYDYYDNPPPPPPFNGWPAGSDGTSFSHVPLAAVTPYDAQSNHSSISDILSIGPLLFPNASESTQTTPTFTAPQEPSFLYNVLAASTPHNAAVYQDTSSQFSSTGFSFPFPKPALDQTPFTYNATQKRSFAAAFTGSDNGAAVPILNDEDAYDYPASYPGHTNTQPALNFPRHLLRQGHYIAGTPPPPGSTSSYYPIPTHQYNYAPPAYNTPAFGQSTSQPQIYSSPHATRARSMTPAERAGSPDNSPVIATWGSSGTQLGHGQAPGPVAGPATTGGQASVPFNAYACLRAIFPPDSFPNPVARVDADGTVRRVCNPWFLFLKYCAAVKAIAKKDEQPLGLLSWKGTPGEIASPIWASLTDEERAYWAARFQQVKAMNEILHPDYAYKPTQNPHKKRKVTEPEADSPLEQPSAAQSKARKPRATQAKKNAVVNQAPLASSPPTASRSVSPIAGPSRSTSFDAHHGQHLSGSYNGSVNPLQGGTTPLTVPTSQFTFRREWQLPSRAAGDVGSGYTTSSSSSASPESSGPQTPFSDHEELADVHTVDSPNPSVLGDAFNFSDWLNESAYSDC